MIDNKKPLLGICVGLQMFADVGYEEKENIFGTQFHPEKSDKIGLKIIDNFINL